MKNPPQISVSIVLWNCRNLIGNCLESLLSQTFQPQEILLIDNASEDGVEEVIQKYLSNSIRYKRLDCNVGFAAAHNFGIRETKGSWILILNPDVTLNSNYLANIVNSLPDNELIGMVTGKVLQMRDNVSSMKQQIIDSTGIGVGYSRLMYDIGQGELDKGQFDKNSYRNAVSCCCCLLKREMLKDVCVNGQYFDELLYMYLEDVDLCWRAFNKGWNGFYICDAIAYHKRGGTRKSASNNYFRKLNLKNRYIVLYKNDKLLFVILFFPFIFFYELLLLLRALKYPSLIYTYLNAFLYIIKYRKLLCHSRASFRRRMAFFSYDFVALFRKAIKF